jgi:hypothetical protein
MPRPVTVCTVLLNEGPLFSEVCECIFFFVSMNLLFIWILFGFQICMYLTPLEAVGLISFQFLSLVISAWWSCNFTVQESQCFWIWNRDFKFNTLLQLVRILANTWCVLADLSKATVRCMFHPGLKGSLGIPADISFRKWILGIKLLIKLQTNIYFDLF